MAGVDATNQSDAKSAKIELAFWEFNFIICLVTQTPGVHITKTKNEVNTWLAKLVMACWILIG